MRNINEFIDYQGILDKIFREEEESYSEILKDDIYSEDDYEDYEINFVKCYKFYKKYKEEGFEIELDESGFNESEIYFSFVYYNNDANESDNSSTCFVVEFTYDFNNEIFTDFNSFNS